MSDIEMQGHAPPDVSDDDDVPFSDSDNEARTQPTPVASVTLNPQLYLSACKVVNNFRPYNSAVSLAPYFGEADALLFRSKLTDRLGLRFSRVHHYVTKLRASGQSGCQAKTVFDKLATVRAAGFSDILSESYTNTKAWSVCDWLAHFVYFARINLFAPGDVTSYASAGIPAALQDDRAYAAYLLLHKWCVESQKYKDKQAKSGTAGKKSERNVKGKAPVSDEFVASSDEDNDEDKDDPAPDSLNNASIGPSRSADATQFSLESRVVGEALQRFFDGLQQELAQASKPSKNAHLAKYNVATEPGGTSEPASLQTLTFAGGYNLASEGGIAVRRLPRPAREMIGIRGDDVADNPLRHYFYRVQGDVEGSARLIGSDHLWGVDRYRRVDFEDGGRIDRKNCSTQLLADYVKELQLRDPAQAREMVDNLERAARMDDVFAIKHLRVLRPESEALNVDNHMVLDAASRPDAEFWKTRFDVLAKVSQYHKKADELAERVAASRLTKDYTADVTAMNENEDVATMTEVPKGMPVRRRTNAATDAKEGKLVEIDTDDPAWRERQKALLGTLVHSKVPKEHYEQSLSDLHITHRSEPRMHGQTGPTLLWPQSTGISKTKKKARRRIKKKKGPRGYSVTDFAGMGKTAIGTGTILAVNNERAFDLNALRQKRDWKGLADYARMHPPKVNLWITDTHLISQAAVDAHQFSDTFIIYVYRNERDKAFALPAGIRQITEPIDHRDPLFSDDNVLKSHVLIIVSKGTLASRHGPRAAADFFVSTASMSHAVAKSSVKLLNYAPTDFTRNLRGHVGITIIDEAHNIGGLMVDVWIAIRWLDADFYVILSATPVPWDPAKLDAFLAVMEDPDLEAEAASLVHQELLANPYDESVPDDHPHCQFQTTTSAFRAFYKREATLVEQGRILNRVLSSAMLRRTYQSQCETHPNGDTHSLQDLMPPSVPIRIHVENSEATRDIWTNESAIAFKSLHHKDRNAPAHNKDKLLINGKYQRILQLGSFCVLLFFATGMHDVTHNNTILEYQKLHDQNLFADYLYKLLTNIYAEGVHGKGYMNLFPFKNKTSDDRTCRMPKRESWSEIVWAFAFRSERIKVMLALVADWVAAQGEKTIIWCMNPTEQEILSCILNMCGVRSVALLARYSAADRASLIDRFKTPLAASTGRVVTVAERDQEIEVLCLSINQNTGLNLHKACRRTMFSGTPSSDAQYCQCCGRTQRIGQTHVCYTAEVYDERSSFNYRVLHKVIKHAIPALMANVNMPALLRYYAAGPDVEDDTEGGDRTVSVAALAGFVRLPNGEIMHKNNPGVPEDAVEVGVEELFQVIYAQISNQSYQAKRDAHKNVEMKKTAHAAEVPVTIPNTPSKYPGLHGQRAYKHQTLVHGMEVLDEHVTSEPEEPLDMEVEVDAAPGETKTVAIKKAEEARLKKSRKAEDDGKGNTPSKRRALRQAATAGAMDQGLYEWPARFSPPRSPVEEDGSAEPETMEMGLSFTPEELDLSRVFRKAKQLDLTKAVGEATGLEYSVGDLEQMFERLSRK